ncbi:glucan endo-1,3-beta-D-glucosidase [Flavobacteriaceae bacterium]|nr:glucan endo-1,3-beta-D-glucosidase [Flavobacteriaceae bacterium]|tara:strand:- start:493 stop:1380 length:888 start_codon:yes stop_codon:yes gene_type:complete
MKKINLIFNVFLVFTALTFVGCEKEEFKLGNIVSPSNVEITAEIVGADEANPNGDGTGVVHFTATGSDVITWKFVHNGVEKLAPSGKMTYAFSTLGTHTYTVSAVAVGSGGSTTDAAKNVEVLATYNPPADLLAALQTGTWRVYAEVGGHMGVGPADSSTSDWWTGEANTKASTGMYDDRYTFGSDGTFSFDTGVDGQVFGKADPMDADLGGDKGQTRNTDAEYTNYPLDNFTAKWSLTAPGGVETINFSGVGFVGFYIGAEQYVILSRSADEMYLRAVGPYDGNGWFFKITNKD